MPRPYSDPNPSWVRGAVDQAERAGVADFDPAILTDESWTPEQKRRWTAQFTVLANDLKGNRAEARAKDRELAVKASMLGSQKTPLVDDVAAGVDQGLADLGSLALRAWSVLSPPDAGQDSLADVVNRQIEEDEQIRARSGEGFASKVVRGASRSIASATGLAATGAGPVGVIGGFAASRANQAATEAKDAGLTGNDAASYVGRAAAIEGGIAGAFQLLGLGGAESMITGGLKRAGFKELLKHTFAELTEENLTEVLDNVNQALSLGKDLTLEQQIETIKATTAQTLLTMGFHGAHNRLAHGSAEQQRNAMIEGLARDYAWKADRMRSVFERAEKRPGDFETNLGHEIQTEARLQPQALAAWAGNNLDAARALVAKPNPSRRDWAEAGLPRTGESERSAAVDYLRNLMQLLDAPPAAIAEQPAPQPSPVTEVAAAESVDTGPPAPPEAVETPLAEEARPVGGKAVPQTAAATPEATPPLSHTEQVRQLQQREIAATVPGSKDWRTADAPTLRGLLKGVGGISAEETDEARVRLNLLENPIREGADWAKADEAELRGLLATHAVDPAEEQAAQARLLELVEARRVREEAPAPTPAAPKVDAFGLIRLKADLVKAGDDPEALAALLPRVEETGRKKLLASLEAAIAAGPGDTPAAKALRQAIKRIGAGAEPEAQAPAEPPKKPKPVTVKKEPGITTVVIDPSAAEDKEPRGAGTVDAVPSPAPESGVEAPAAPPAPATSEKPKGFLRNLSEEKRKKFEEAQKRALSKIRRANVGVDPTLLADGLEMTTLLLEAGVRNFAEYASSMASEFRPYLRHWWAGAGQDEVSKAEAEKIFDELDGETPTEGPEAKGFEERAREIVQSDDDAQAKSRAMKALAKDFDLDDKEVQERVESILVEEARAIVAETNLSARDRFGKLVDLYNVQPRFSSRTAQSKQAQAYSTPVPLAYALSLMAGVDEKTTLYEPTAGMGALTIAARPSKTAVNDFSDGGRNRVGQGRLAELGKKGYAAVTDNDATEWKPEEKFGRVLANPPFGGGDKVVIDGYPIRKLEHKIALKALEAMKDDGQAALILGSSMDGSVGESERVFFNYLLNHYHVAGIFEVDGDLYANQGAAWPVRVVVVAGRRVNALDKQDLAPTKVESLDSWDAVWEKIEPVTVEAAKAQALRQAELPSPPSPPTPPKPKKEKKPKAPKSEKPAPATAGERAETPAPSAAPAEKVSEGKAINDRQQVYVSASKAKPIGTIVNSMLAPETAKALTQLVGEVGDLDSWLASQLGYDNVAQLRAGLAAEQIDGVGLAIRNLLDGRSLIIGDQTGIGKGRQAAALIAFAKKQGWTPIFLTADPKLFSDMYADTQDIGKEVSPLLLGNPSRAHVKDKSKVTEVAAEDEDEDSDEQGEEIFEDDAILVRSPSDAKQLAIMDRIASGKTSLADEGFDAVFLPYSQLSGHDNPRHKFLTHLAEKSQVMFIMDESHKAAGAASITGAFMRGGTVQKGKGEEAEEVEFPGVLNAEGTKGVVYLSATYAKRPETMPLYYKTSLGIATDDAEQLQTAFKKGGVALQQWAASALTGSGEMIRRERDFAGVRVEQKDTAESEEERAKAIANVDLAAEALRAIVSFSRLAKEKIEETQDKATADTEGRLKTGDFSSVLHNYVAQLLLASKVDAAVKEAVASHKKGEATLIVLSNTMESFLKDYVKENGLKIGDHVELDFGDVLQRALNRTMRSQGKTATGLDDVVDNTASDLGLEEEYEHVLGLIDKVRGLGLHASPIDAIHHALRKAGLRTAELTGRSMTISADGTLSEREDSDKNAVVNAFQAGKLDTVILNSSGATGISMHASEKNPPAGRRPRHMVIAQPDLNIDTVKQVIGRILRTGMAGAAKDMARYTLLSSPVQAERRPFAVLAAKLASLNANTTADAEDDFKISSLDFINKYGDRVVSELLREDGELASDLNLEVSANEDGEVETKQGIAKQATGRMAILPNDRQKEFYDLAADRYKDLVEELKEAGEYDLEVEVQESWDAKLQQSVVLDEATDRTNPFLSGLTLGEWSINDPRKPMKVDDVRSALNRNFGSSDGAEVNAAVKKQIADYLAELEKLEAAYVGEEPTPPKAARGDANKAEWEAHDRRAAAHAERAKRVAQSKAIVTENMKDLFGGGYVVVTLKSGEGDNLTSADYTGVLIGLKLPVPKSGNPYRASTIRATFAVESPRRTVTLPLSRLANFSASVRPLGLGRKLSSFGEQAIPDRAKRSIFTGNLIKALAVAGKGQITTFRTSEGEAVTGLVMPAGWKLSDSKSDPRKQIKDSKAAARFLNEWGTKIKAKGSDGKFVSKFVAARRGDTFEIEVASKKKAGGTIYLDSKLLSITGDWVELKSSGKMVVRGLSLEEFTKAFDHLAGRGFTFWAANGRVEDVAKAHGKEADMRLGMPDRDPPPGGGGGAPRSNGLARGGVQPGEITSMIEDLWKVSVRAAATFKKKFKEQRALGWYAPGLGEMRLKNDGRVVTVALHELGHHFDRELGRWSRAQGRTPGVGAELEQLGRDLYGDTIPEGGYRSEGFAEFIREYLTGGADLSSRAPTLYRWFTTEYLTSKPEEAAKLRKLQDKVLQFLSQTPQEAIEVFLQPPKREWTAERLLADAQEFVDNKIRNSLYPILRGLQETGLYTPGKLSPRNDPAILASFFAGTAGGRTRHAALSKTVDLWGRESGAGLREVLLPITAQGDQAFKEWKEYAVAKRALLLLDKKGAKYNPGISREVAEAIVAEREKRPAYRATLDAYTEFAHRALRPLVESGFMSEAEFEAIETENPIYVSFMRHVEAEGRGAGTGGRPIYKTRSGGNQTLVDPIDAMLLQYAKIQKTAMQHEVVRSIVAFYDSNKNKKEAGTFLGRFLSEIPLPDEAHVFTADKIADYVTGVMAKAGINEADAEEAIDEFWNDQLELGVKGAAGRQITVFSKGKSYKGALSVVVNGKRRLFQMKPALLEVLQGIDPEPWIGGSLGKAVRKVTAVQRLGITGLSPAFSLVRNFIRDQFTAGVYADYSFQIPFWTALTERLDGTFSGEWAARYEASGVPLSGYFGQSLEAAQDLASQATGHGATRYQRLVKSPLNTMVDWLTKTEAWPRILEFRAAYEHARQKWGDTRDATVLAGVASKDLTVDFKRSGSWSRKANEVVLFFNAAVQSSDKALRAFGAAEPAPWAKLQGRGENLSRSTQRALTLTASAVLIYLLFNRGDPDWEELEPHQKWGYFNIKLGPKRFLRVPLPFEVGSAFGALPVATIEGGKAPGEALGVAFKSGSPVDLGSMHEIARNVAAVGPIVDVLANKDWKGSPIVPETMKDHLIAAQQHGPRASWLAKELGKTGNWSPAEIDHLLNGYSGQLYGRVTSLLDGSSPVRLDEPSSLPVIGTLFLRPGAGSRLVGDFYDRLKLLRQRQGSKVATLAEIGELAEAERINDSLNAGWRARRSADDPAEADKLLVEAQAKIRAHNARNKSNEAKSGLGVLLYRATDPRAPKDVEIPEGVSEAEAVAALRSEALRRAEATRAAAKRYGHKVRPLPHYVRVRDESGNVTAYGERQTRLIKKLRR